MTSDREDRDEIRDLIQRWVITRDSGDWSAFASVWHRGARMHATWFQGDAADFIAASRLGWDTGVEIEHFLGGTAVDLVGDRAIAQTRMMISQRAVLHGVLCDVECTGRFYDFLERRDGVWGIVLRQPIYEKDRLVPVVPSPPLPLDQSVLARFPQGYRHLAYLQHSIGMTVTTSMPGLKGPEVTELYESGQAWLQGSPVSTDVLVTP